MIFYVFISILKVISSFFYMAIFSNTQNKWYDIQSVQIQMAVYESCFLIEMILQFFRKVTPDGQSKELKDIMIISKNYISTNFIWHLIPLIPFQYMKIY